MYKVLLVAIFLISIQAKSTDFSFYVYASEWAGSVCKTNDCNQDEGVSTTFWNIHGLWPSDGTMNPNYCTEEKFDATQIKDLKEDLAKYWNGLYSSADAFHAHEWEKHGTCSKMSQYDFFSAVLKVAESLDVYGTLVKHGVSPGKSVDCTEVAQIIQQEYGVQSFTLTADNKGNLASLELCVDLDFKVRDCPKAQICKGSHNYPSFTSTLISK